jgi:hypothetical protein
MEQYLRIPKNKFWAWVFASLALGLLLGAGAALVLGRASATKQIDDLKKQVASQASAAASSATALQSRLDSAEASLTSVSAQYAQLQQQNTAAKPSTPSDGSASSPSSTTVTLEVISRTVVPSTVATGDPITMTARVKGHPDKVTMRIILAATGASTTYSLKKSSTVGDVERWKRTVSAPKAKGTYRYYATAYLGAKSATMPGAKPSTFTVK